MHRLEKNVKTRDVEFSNICYSPKIYRELIRIIRFWKKLKKLSHKTRANNHFLVNYSKLFGIFITIQGIQYSKIVENSNSITSLVKKKLDENVQL